MQSALDSVQAQLLVHGQQYPLYTNAVPPLSLEADVRAAGGKLEPPPLPRKVTELQAQMGKIRNGIYV